ncbi:MAG: oligosaccharide flippase family protein [Symploca sp. SIO2G7]|nr:oligosaccharide flippase family protein [Symploca sp. SIO2G7]
MRSIIQIIRSLLPRNSFVRGVALLGGGAATSQLLLMVSAPILTRLYSTEQFGIVAVFVSILSIFNVVSTLRYELAIPIAKDDEEAVHSIALAICVALATSFLVLLVVVGFRGQIAEAVKIPTMGRYLWLLPLGILLGSTYRIFYYWAIRIKAFSAITRTRLAQAISSIVVQIGGAPLGTIAMLLGQVINQAAGISSLGTLALRDHWFLFKAIRFKQVLWVGWRYRQFPYFSTWGSLLNAIGTQISPILFAVLFSSTTAGIYALAHRVLSLPMSLVGQAIGNVFLARAAEAKREGNLAGLVAKVHEKLAQIAMPPTLVLAIVGPDLFVWVFGPEWREAGVFARLMAPMLYFQFILSPISTLFSVLEKQKQGMFVHVIMVTVRCSSLLVGAWIGDVRLAVLLFAVGSATSYLIFFVWVVIMSGNSYSVIIKHTIQTLKIAMLLVSPIVIGCFLNLNASLLKLSVLITSFLIGYQYFTVLKST